MQAASRESLEAVQATFDAQVNGLDADGIGTLADDLAAVAKLLLGEVVLRKYLAGRAEDSAGKHAMADKLFGGKIGAPALEVLKSTVAQRWSRSRDIPTTLIRYARLAILIDAERAGQLETVEDELFRLGRTLDANHRLASLLGDHTKPVDGRIALLNNVIGNKTTSYTARLVQQTVRGSHGEHFDEVVADLAELAAQRRGESVAHVVAAAPLTDAQIQRLESALSRVYGRNMSVQLDIDPEVLGGLRVTVGDEVVDGTIASRLVSAAAQLPR